MCIVLPIQIKKIRSTDKNANVNVITVNKIFLSFVKRNWCKTLSRRRKNFTNNTIEIYQYAAQQLKHLPSKSLDDIREILLYWKKAVVLTGGRDRTSNSSTTPADRTDSNLGERVTNFLALIGKKCTTEIHFYILRSGKLPA